MPQITAYKCRFTNKLFDDKSKFIKHLYSTRVLMRKKREFVRLTSTSDFVFSEMRQTCGTIYEIEKFIYSHFATFSHNGVITNNSKKPNIPPKLLLLNFSNIKFQPISASHYAPIGQNTNWNRDSNKPTEFMGWKMYMNLTVDQDIFFGISDMFTRTGINTGTGGASKNRYGHLTCGYEVCLFADDWPAMTRNLIMNKLRIE